MNFPFSKYLILYFTRDGAILERITWDRSNFAPLIHNLQKALVSWNKYEMDFFCLYAKAYLWWHREIWQSLSDENENVPTFFLVRDLFLGWSVAQSVTGLRKKWNKFELPIRAGFCAKNCTDSADLKSTNIKMVKVSMWLYKYNYKYKWVKEWVSDIVIYWAVVSGQLK